MEIFLFKLEDGAVLVKNLPRNHTVSSLMQIHIYRVLDLKLEHGHVCILLYYLIIMNHTIVLTLIISMRL